MPSSTLSASLPTSSTPAWIYGQFPSSLTIINSRLAEGVIADVPFYSVGILAITVTTFFLVMSRMQKYIFNVLLATFLAFLSAILDLGQLITISWGVLTSTVFPLRIARELGYAVSFGLRFFFFWQFVAMPPRGEIPVLATPGRSLGNRKSFVFENEFHSGSWDRWGFVGIMTKYILLIGTIVVGVTQAIWRLGFAFGLVRFTSVYQIDTVIQITMSALFLLKLAGNSYISPLMPLWKTVRDYLPVVAAISVGLGIAIGNLMCMLFSESPLGRFLQAIELYILILYLLIATFYRTPAREPTPVHTFAHQRTRADSSFVGIDMTDSMRISPFRITPPRVSTPQVLTMRGFEAADMSLAPTRLQSDDSRRQSTAERVVSWIQNRLSGRPGDHGAGQQMLSGQDVESVQRKSYEYTKEKVASPNDTPTRPIEKSGDSWGDPTYANVRTPPTGKDTSNNTPQFSNISPGQSSKLYEPPITPATSYAPVGARPMEPKGPPAIPTLSSSAVSGALSSAIATSLAPVLPLGVRSLPSNPRPRPRETSPWPEPIPLALPAPILRIPSSVLPESPSGTSFRITREYGLPSPSLAPAPEAQLSSRQQQMNSGDESPIYGLEGIIQSLGGDLLPDEELNSQQGSLTERNSTTYSPGAASFSRKQAEIDRSSIDLPKLVPGGPSVAPQSLYATSDGASLSEPSLAQESTSFQSDFTLSRFPSPPGGDPGFSQRNSVATRLGEIDLDDIRFTLMPPRIPAAADGRQMSFPSSTRGSDIFQLRLKTAETPNRTQWDVTSFIEGSEPRTPLSASFSGPDSQGPPLPYPENQFLRDTLNTQRLSMVIEALSNGSSTPDRLDEEGEGSVQGARLVDLRRKSSLTLARIVKGPLSAAASSVNSTTSQGLAKSPAHIPTAAERLAAFRARPPRKNTLPSSPRPAYKANSPVTQERSPLGKSAPMQLVPQPQPTLQPQPSISSIQAQSNGSQTQQPTFSQSVVLPSATRINNVLSTSPPRGLRNLRIGGRQTANALRTSAFERPRPAPLVIPNGIDSGASSRAGVI
ncbi:ABC transporter C family member 12 [Rhizoctonia solani]|uniref:ABC transporter C family member 12 n=1 Tax=Rhizoctonia solani TaxID=456999 RepID=A0A0K6GFX8_9AGAM|nr:ABC transporter C family member 12 [Rhizoctonia solani]